MVEKVVKKKNVCKRNKKNWRKYIDTKDVDDFLDKKRLEERTGGPVKQKKNEDLFVIDTSTIEESRIEEERRLTKKERAKLPPTCLQNLQPMSSVPDPIIKRNRVKTKEERKSLIRKSIEAYKRDRGIIPHKVLVAAQDRRSTRIRKRGEPKEHIFNKDIWVEEENPKDNPELEWLSEDAVKHTLVHAHKFKVNAPKDALTSKSVLPPIEPPHPGMSYNPSFKDHQELLKEVMENENKRLKEEAHLKRVTTDAFRKVKKEDREKHWLEEMSQGLIKDETEVKEEDDGRDYKAINPPSSCLKLKTRKQKRIQKELRAAALLRKEKKVEKKKAADIYKLKFINRALENDEGHFAKKKELREKIAGEKAKKTKRLGAKPFVEPDLEFNRPHDLRGNLRSLKREGNLLVDRFYSLQKRNILAPSTKQIGLKKAKVKKFTKESHKIPELEMLK